MRKIFKIQYIVKRIGCYFIAALCLLGIVAVNADAKSRKQREAAFEQEMSEFIQKTGTVGVSVVFVKNNRIVYNHNFGLKNVERNEPLQDNSLFRIASISKSFTSTSMMQMIEQGKVSLSTDVSELAGFKIRNPKYPDTVITLEMLLSHTSSINDSQGYFSLDGINPEKNPNWAKCYNSYEPGKGYEYCNLNYNLCGTFLEKLSGERFDQYVVGHVLKPLGLYGGYCVDSLQVERFASLYQTNRAGALECVDDEAYEARSERIRNYHMGYDTPLFSPTGGMKISAIDLARYMIMHMNYGYSPLAKVRIIPEELSKSMQTPRSDPEHYGLALHHEYDYVKGLDLVGHTGGAYGLNSAMFFNREGKYGFVVITNGYEKARGYLGSVIRIMHRNFVEK